MKGINYMTLPIENIKHMQIAMGNFCNQHCSFCYQEDRSSDRSLDEVIWKQKLLPIYDYLKTVTIIGGEPTVMKNAWEFLNLLYSKYPHIRFKTISNGINFNAQWRDIFLERGEKVIFSINAGTEATYNKIIYNGNWSRVIKNIKEVLNSRTGSSLQIHASYVVTDANASELSGFIKMMKSMGVDKCIFIRDFVKGLELPKNYDHIIHAIEIAQDISMQISGLEEIIGSLRTNMLVRNIENKKELPMCALPWNSIDITQDGFVSFCCSAYLPIGNLKKLDITEIWNSTVATKMREAISNGNYKMCKSNCPFNPNPLCFYRAAGRMRALYWDKLYLTKRYITKILHDPISGGTAMIKKMISRKTLPSHNLMK